MAAKLLSPGIIGCGQYWLPVVPFQRIAVIIDFCSLPVGMNAPLKVREISHAHLENTLLSQSSRGLGEEILHGELLMNVRQHHYRFRGTGRVFKDILESSLAENDETQLENLRRSSWKAV